MEIGNEVQNAGTREKQTIKNKNSRATQIEGWECVNHKNEWFIEVSSSMWRSQKIKAYLKLSKSRNSNGMDHTGQAATHQRKNRDIDGVSATALTGTPEKPERLPRPSPAVGVMEKNVSSEARSRMLTRVEYRLWVWCERCLRNERREFCVFFP
jgi:hypothetical protein